MMLSFLRSVGRAVLPICALATWLCVIASSAGATPLVARDFKMAGDASRMRVVIQFDSEPEPHWFLIRDPHRLVIDLAETAMAVDPKELDPRGLVESVRFGNLEDGHSRLILAGHGPFTVERLDVMKNESEPGYRLVVDLVAASEQQFEQALADQAATTGSTRTTAKGDRLGAAEQPRQHRFTIVLDPGHGGIDPGAKGASGALEKDVTLGFAQDLKKRLEQAGKYDVFLTRDDDEFLRLDERVRIARQHDADLFISLHADTINVAGVRGATVYTVADRASDALAAAAADRENLSDQIAGVAAADENHEVADILVDLIRRETHSFSIQFARSLVGELSSTVELIKNPHRSAGFRVLRAPDVPSVLVELGYLSNPEEEKQLRDPTWRDKAAGAIASAIGLFAEAKSAAGG